MNRQTRNAAIAALKEDRAKLQAECDALTTAINALGGTIATVGKARAGKSNKGWPKGKPRGPRKPPAPDPVTGLTPIQKAQAARAANIAARKAQAAKPEGAVLAEAAAS